MLSMQCNIIVYDLYVQIFCCKIWKEINLYVRVYVLCDRYDKLTSVAT